MVREHEQNYFPNGEGTHTQIKVYRAWQFIYRFIRVGKSVVKEMKGGTNGALDGVGRHPRKGNGGLSHRLT